MFLSVHMMINPNYNVHMMIKQLYTQDTNFEKTIRDHTSFFFCVFFTVIQFLKSDIIL